jgi:hypothetical protein
LITITLFPSPAYIGILTQHINIDILVDITKTVGGIAPIVACIILLQIVDDNAVGSQRAPWVRMSLTDGTTIVDPLDLRFRYTRRFAMEFNCFILCSVNVLRLLGEVWDSYNVTLVST